jgi:DNA repair protein RecN (Recombination protein N)
MIEEISVKELGVIKDATLTFTKGLTTITGETGAGKTMVLTALSLLLGKRSDSGLIRHGANATSVEGCWYVPQNSPANQLVEDAGGVIEDGQLFINRTVQSDGKSKAVVGGKATPAAVLNAVGEHLVAIHGQSDQIRLKSPVAQREALDRYAGAALKAALEAYNKKYSEWRHLTKEINDIKNNMQARQVEFEYLQTAVKDIEKVTPQRNEDETLRIETEKLSNLEGLQEAASVAMAKLSTEDYEGTDITSLTADVAKALLNVADADPKMSELADMAENLRALSQELTSGVSDYLSAIDFDALNSLNEMHERRAEIARLIKKYGSSLDEVLDMFENAGVRLEELNPESNNIEAMELQLVELTKELESAAESLYLVRKNAANDLSRKVTEELAGLAMGGSSMVINVDRVASYTSTGADEINFLLKHHGGGIAKPLGQGASGGELSRIMLSLELVLADPTTTPTFVFDEVDSGVGGSTAIEIGKRLASLAKTAQVIVVTHLPQVAAFADNHLRVLKTQGEDFTSTDVKQLDEGERLQEIARMLSGLQGSDTGTAHARELIEVAGDFKNN